MGAAAGEAHELTIALDDGSHRMGVDAANVNDGCRLDTYLHLPCVRPSRSSSELRRFRRCIAIASARYETTATMARTSHGPSLDGASSRTPPSFKPLNTAAPAIVAGWSDLRDRRS